MDNADCSLRYTFYCIKKDAGRYDDWRRQSGFWVSLSYRIRRLRKLGGAAFFWLLPVDAFFGIVRRLVADSAIPSSLPVGPGLYLPHPTGIIFNSQAVIGEFVTIFHQVTIGEWHGEAPIIGDECALFAGAKVFGGIIIGRCSKIGANCTLNRSVPEYSTVSLSHPNISSRKNPHKVKETSSQTIF
jgi:serine O-acetyltransferase